MARGKIIIDSDGEEDNADIMEVDSENNGRHQRRRNGVTASSSSSPHGPLQQQLENQTGVRPSGCWLDQCLCHLNGGNNTANNSNGGAEGVWNQILYADLRDVVRDEDAGNSNSRSDKMTASTQLRAAITKSRRRRPTSDVGANNNDNSDSKYKSGKATLSSDFRLLVQMEEVVDVTMNEEQRLAAMGGGGGAAAATAANNGNTGGNRNGGNGNNYRNPKYRCLKMAYSDGYCSDCFTVPRVDALEGRHEDDDVLPMAMETSPVRNLSVSSPPGLKLLLHGPIDVRLGVLQLNDGNCTVMGGEIEEWKEVWKKAKERAQREKGLGVDPTIKALIWNPLMGDEEEADEGEGESGDVAAAPPAAAPPAAAPPPPMQAPPPLPPQPIITPNQPTTRPNLNISTLSQNPYQSQTSNAANVSSRGSGTNNLRQRTMDSYPKKPRPETTRLQPSNASSTGNKSRQTTLNNASNNPYQRTSNNNGGRNTAQNNRVLPQQHQQSNNRGPSQQQQRLHQPPPMRNNTNIIPIDDSPPSSTSHKPSTQPPLQQRANPYASLRPSTTPPSVSVPTSAITATNTVSSTPIPFTSNPSFSELKSILQSLRNDRTLYERYHGNIITVPCKMDAGPSKVFNIVKAGGGEKKKSKLKKEKKYEFLLVGKFFGPKQSDGAIACRVDSSIVATYFEGYTPAEIRRLSREDKVRANRIVNQSSSQFIHDFSSLGQFQMKLLMAPDEFFGKTASLPSDWLSTTANPVLLVVKRTT